MRKNSSKSSHPNKHDISGNIKEMSDDDFFASYKRSSSKKSDKRRLLARRKLERYKEDKELAGWLDDSHLES
ncbi:hypothetical protein NBRC116583_10060 [Arenicella sp. 4NH20-0111]|uniref:PA3496 family putative envelope integrity protein n=1 Tax=Arenicella sp. 4NH20-0111 TaxID=3127648 RepID=UPI0031020203